MSSSTNQNQNPWAPYDTYKDCSLGICSIYCPQWCFYVLPPPPPPDDNPSSSSGPTFSPLIIAIIGILASAFLLVTYYTLITRYCRRNPTLDLEANPDRDSWQPPGPPGGLDEVVIKSIAVCKYKRGEGAVKGTECSVCLSEFQDDESLRLLPKCYHAFHVPCIDTWLKSHPNCPLCRANVALPAPTVALPTPSPAIDAETEHSVLETEHSVLGTEHSVLTDHHEGFQHEGENSRRGDDGNGNGEEEGVKRVTRSMSFGTFSVQRRIIDEPDNDDDRELQRRCGNGIGRSVSTGRLMCLRYDKGNNNSSNFF